MEQGQGESTGSIQNAAGFSGTSSEGINSPGIDAQAGQIKQGAFATEWPGPLDGPLGYSET